MKLSEYINNLCSLIELENQITIEKFEHFFTNLQNNQTIFYYKPYSKFTTEHLCEIFNKMYNKDAEYTVVMTNGDFDIPCITKYWYDRDHIPYTDELQARIETMPLDDFLEMELLEKIPANCNIFCNAVIRKHPRLHMIPLGRDPKGDKFYIPYQKTQKDILCYYNCSIPPKTIHWYGRIREYIFNSAVKKDWIVCENIGTCNSRLLNQESFANYYQKLNRSKFMICPRGCSLDTYRLYDCLYRGCIPIVVRYAGYEILQDLPILFIDEWQDYCVLTQEILDAKWQVMLDTDYNYEKLKFGYWENIICKRV